VSTPKAFYACHKIGGKIVYIAEEYCAVARSWRIAMSKPGIMETQMTKDRLIELMQDPANESLLQPLLRRHPYLEEDPDPHKIFIAIGAAFVVGGSDDEVTEAHRAEAFWAFMALMPELNDILDIRKKTQEDFIEHLYKVIVKEGRFDLEKGRDPRPFVRRIAKNWKRDGSRKEDRIQSLDEPRVAGEEGTALRSVLPNPTSIEDNILDKLVLDGFLARLDFLTQNEKFVIEAVLADLPKK
jgi:hypothetical protein